MQVNVSSSLGKFITFYIGNADDSVSFMAKAQNLAAVEIQYYAILCGELV